MIHVKYIYKVTYTIIDYITYIIVWFQLLRDTFAGKILTTFQNEFPVCKFLSDFYRQKCRAAAEILGAWEKKI